MRTVLLGRHALLVECAGADEVAATYALLRARAEELGATDVVPAARTVLVDGLVDPEVTRELIASWRPEPWVTDAGDGAVLELRVRYDGPDLDEVARQWDLSTAEVVRIHTGSTFVVLFCGFAPGFGYCTGLPAGLTVRRRSEPRPAVPAGSVALAGEYTSVYPGASPGGWQLIGRTDAVLWQPGADVPALLVPGTRVQFVEEDR